MAQQPSLDPGEELNQILRDFERENAHLFAPPIETPPMPNYECDFLSNDYSSPSDTDTNPFGLNIPSFQGAPPAPPPSLAVPSPLSMGHLTPAPTPPQQVAIGNSPLINHPSSTGTLLTIVEQPVERCRFRYKAEQGPHGALRGVSWKRQKSSPKVKVGHIGKFSILYDDDTSIIWFNFRSRMFVAKVTLLLHCGQMKKYPGRM